MFIPAPSVPPLDVNAPLAQPPLVLADIIAAQADPDATIAEGDAVSFLAGADPIEAALQWQYKVRRGSGAALGDNGHELHTITKATPQAPMQLEDETRRVAQKFVERGQLANLRVAASVTDDPTATGIIEASATNVLADDALRLSIGA